MLLVTHSQEVARQMDRVEHLEQINRTLEGVS
jgi:ABC-type lipoprotein export system ATPase subunit